MSKTPRTDEHILHHGNGNWHPSAFVLASFARQIETELAEARAEIERKDKLIEQMREVFELSESQAARARFFAYKTLAVIERAHDSTIEEQAALCSEGQSITELVAAKDALIEQMREALELSESQAARARFFAYKTALELSESKLIDARARVTRLERIVNDS